MICEDYPGDEDCQKNCGSCPDICVGLPATYTYSCQHRHASTTKKMYSSDKKTSSVDENGFEKSLSEFIP